MTVSSRALVELVLLGPTNDRRQLQDSPVLGDVWIAYAMKPAEAVDLLITPHKTQAAGPVAVRIAKRLDRIDLPRSPGQESQIAYLQGLVAGRLFFEELLRVIVPMTQWWNDRKIQEGLQQYDNNTRLKKRLQAVLDWTKADDEDEQARTAAAFAEFSSLDRYVSLAGIILWTSKQPKTKKSPKGAGEALVKLKSPEPIVKLLGDVFKKLLDDPDFEPGESNPQIWQVSLNRKAMPALSRSVPSVKGDAARTLFKVRCESIRWAVLDSGIDANHPAFNDENGESRIIKAFDFSNIRRIVSLDNLDTKTAAFKAQLKELREGREKQLSAKDATDKLKALAEDAENDRSIHWELVEPFITIDPPSSTILMPRSSACLTRFSQSC